MTTIHVNLLFTILAALVVLSAGRALVARTAFLKRFSIPAPVVGGVLIAVLLALADLAREIDRRLEDGGAAERAVFETRVRSLMTDVPDLPNFSRFHDVFRDNASGASNEGHMREAFFMAYDESNCEFVRLTSPDIDARLKNGPEMVSANFVIPYPPGFPIMVPGQVITQETITFMRKLDVKEIHGYHADQGLKLLTPQALAAHGARKGQ